MTTFTPLTIRNLTIRNRLIRAGCYEGLAREGMVTQELIEHHRALAAGGIGMSTVAYCAVSADGRGFEHELWMRPEIREGLENIVETVHSEGAAVSLQLVHTGFFADPNVIDTRTLGASKKYCAFRGASCRAMSVDDIAQKADAFAIAAREARDAGFDAVEIHAGHGYLLSQFLSPWTNHRRDSYGGSLENRLRFPCEVIKRVRETGIVTVVKMNLDDGFRGGFGGNDAVEAAKAFERAGADMLVPSGGFTARTPFYMLRGRLPVREMAANQKSFLMRLSLLAFGRFMVPHHRFSPVFFMERARAVVRAVRIPVAYVGGALSLEQIESALSGGFAAVQIGRASIRNPDFAARLKSGALSASDCDHCNRCVAAMDGGGVYCVSDSKGLLYE